MVAPGNGENPWWWYMVCKKCPQFYGVPAAFSRYCLKNMRISLIDIISWKRYYLPGKDNVCVHQEY
jgi:hypothetical protein